MLLKFGHITNVNEDNYVIVQLNDMDNFTTDYIPFLVHNPCYKVEPVAINALVAVLLNDELDEGVCLGYVNSQSVTPGVTYITGDLIVNGNITSSLEIKDKKGTMQEMRDIYNSHTNPDGGGTEQKM